MELESLTNQGYCKKKMKKVEEFKADSITQHTLAPSERSESSRWEYQLVDKAPSKLALPS